MSKLAAQATRDLRQIILDALGRAVAEKALPMEPAPDFTIETPADPSHGDFATNVAMVSAKAFHMAPRKIAEALSPYFEFSGTYFEKFEIAGPGFINFFLSPRFYAAVLQDIEALQDGYGRSDFGKGKKINVEFVSANPTGPMHMGNARGGALGDCLAAVLDAAGYQVSREFYINDAGNQIDKFALSLDIRYQQIFKGEEAVPMPEDCYQGADILERAQEFADLYGDSCLEKSQEERQKALVDFALPKNIAKMQSDLKKYRIEYDTWFHESVLHNDGEIQDTLKILTEKGMTYELDGALWYKATDFGAEKDEVLVRKNGNPTYFAADIAYHRNKFQRGFDRCIDIWGADHHGHVVGLQVDDVLLPAFRQRHDVVAADAGVDGAQRTVRVDGGEQVVQGVHVAGAVAPAAGEGGAVAAGIGDGVTHEDDAGVFREDQHDKSLWEGSGADMELRDDPGGSGPPRNRRGFQGWTRRPSHEGSRSRVITWSRPSTA